MVYELKNLSYAYDALEPQFDAQTMFLHHDKHHAAYVNKLNSVLADCKNIPDISLEELIKSIFQLPVSDDVKSLIKFNAGGHFNHELLWEVISPAENKDISKQLLQAIEHSFGSFQNLISAFEQSAMSHLGSGWTWLCIDTKNSNELFICSTLNHDNPLMKGYVAREGVPILLMDLWEHAYYLKYNNRKADYIKAFLEIINWKVVSDNFKKLV